MGMRGWRRGAVVAVGALLGVGWSPPAHAEPGPGPVAETVIDGHVVDSFELPSPLVDPSTVGGHLEGHKTVPVVHVLLPDGYAEHPDQQYPVFWWLHGANGGSDGWLHSDVLHYLAERDAIVVMPDGGTFGMYSNWWNGGERADPAWATYHLQLLRSVIEQRYRIRPERRWHAIGGISMGGQGALRYAALLPGYFGSAVGMSAAMPDVQALETQFGVSLVGAANGGPFADFTTIWGHADGPYAEGNSAYALAENLADTRIYLVSGTGINCSGDPTAGLFNLALDSITELFIRLQQPKFAARARHFGADVTEAYPPCGVHTFGTWDRALAAMAGWDLFADVPSQPARWAYRTIQTTGEMWGLRYSFATPPRDIVRFQRQGQLLIVDGGTGGDVVTIDGGPGCSLRLPLPTIALLSPACPGPI